LLYFRVHRCDSAVVAVMWQLCPKDQPVLVSLRLIASLLRDFL